jgi:hypothetical protein
MYHFFFVLLVDFKFSRHFLISLIFISLKVSLFLALLAKKVQWFFPTTKRFKREVKGQRKESDQE